MSDFRDSYEVTRDTRAKLENLLTLDPPLLLENEFVILTDEDNVFGKVIGGVIVTDFDATYTGPHTGLPASKILTLNADEVAARSAADTQLQSNIDAEEAARIAADNALDTAKVNRSGDTITGDLTVGGNLTVEGTTTAVNSDNLSIEDNLIELNKGETGAGVSAVVSGLEIDRGTLSNAQLLFDETDDFFKTSRDGGTTKLRILTEEDTGAGAGLDADTLDGLDSLQFLRSDVADTVAGALTFTAETQHNENIGASWGSNSEFRIAFTAGGSYLTSREHGGIVVIRGENALGTVENFVVGRPDDGVELWADGSLILKTALTGVNVTGDVDASGAIKFGANNWNLSQSTAATSLLKSAASNLFLEFQNSTSATIGYIHGDIDEFGLLDHDGNWFIRNVLDSHTDFYDNNEKMFSVGVGGVTGTYGTVEVKGVGKGGWDGYSINGQWVFMSQDDTRSGIMNDSDNAWAAQFYRGGKTELYFGGAAKFATTGTGVTVTGDVTATNFIGSADDAKLLDGLDSLQFLRSDVADVKTAGHLKFSDNVHASFGDDADFSIYWDGTNYKVKGYADGAPFWIEADNAAGLAKSLFHADPDGAATIYHKGVGHIQTTNTGIFVAGDITATDLHGSADDAKLLDGLDSLQFLRSDANDTSTGNLTFDGGSTFNGNITANGSANFNSTVSILGGTTGLNFGSKIATVNTDLSKHLSLYGTNHGFSITNATLNIVAGAGTASVDVIADYLKLNGDRVPSVTSNPTITGAWIFDNDVRVKVDGTNFHLDSDAVTRTTLVWNQDGTARWYLRLKDNGAMSFDPQPGATTLEIDNDRILTTADLADLNDADTIDGLDSTQFLRSDVADTLNADLTLNPANMLLVGAAATKAYVFAYAPAPNFGLTFNSLTSSYDFTEGTGGSLLHIPASIGGTMTYDGSFSVTGDVTATNFIGSADDAKLLDGLDSTQFVRSDVDDTVAGDLTFTGARAIKGENSGGNLHIGVTDPAGSVYVNWDESGGGAPKFIVGNGSGGIALYLDYLGNLDITGTFKLGASNLQLFEGGLTDELVYRSGNVNTSTLEFQESDGVDLGYIHGNESSNFFGLLDKDRQWAIKHVNDSHTDFYDNNELMFSVGVGGVTGNFGNVEVKGAGKGGFRGYSINADSAFMSDGSRYGLYDNINNVWQLYIDHGGAATLRHGASDKLATTATGISVTGDVVATGDIDATHVGGVAAVDNMALKGGLGNAVDLNTFQETGIWQQQSNAQAGTGTNYPQALAGTLTVTDNGNFTTQRYQIYTNTATYERTNYNGTWYGWRRVARQETNGDLIVDQDLHAGGSLLFGANDYTFGEVSSAVSFLKGGSLTYTQLQLRTSDNISRGAINGEVGGLFGLVDADGNWAIKHVRDSHTDFLDNNELMFSVGVGGVTGSFGTVETKGNGKGGYEGYSINGRSVFMDNGSAFGIYDDTNNKWAILGTKNAGIELRYNNAAKLLTTNTGVNVTGNLVASSNVFGIAGTFTGEVSGDSLDIANAATIDGELFAGKAVTDTGSLSSANVAATFSSRGIANHEDPESTVMRLMRDGHAGVIYAGNAQFDLSRWEDSGTASRTQLSIKLSHATPGVADGEPLKLRSDGSVHANSFFVANDATIYGNLTVQGTTTGVNTTDLEIEDNNITLNKGEAGAGVSAGTAGLIIDRGTLDDALIQFDEASDKLTFSRDNGVTKYTILTTEDEGTGSGMDADTVDGLHAASFIRSDATDTATGAVTFTSSGFTFNGHHYINAYDASGNHYPHWKPGGTSNKAIINHRVYKTATTYDVLRIAGGETDITWMGAKLWSANNDGAGSGLDADTVDGIHAASFLRSDAADTASKRITFQGAIADRPIMPDGFIGAATGDTINRDIWGISGEYYPSHATAANQWGIKWDNVANAIIFVGLGVNKLHIDLDTAGAITAAANVVVGGDLDASGDLIFGASNLNLSEAGGGQGRFTSASATYSRISFATDDNVVRGYIGYDSGGYFGINDSNDLAAIVHYTDSRTDFYDNNEKMFSVGVGGVTGSYGTVQVKGSGKGGWQGYSIDGDAVYMSNGTYQGLYDDTNNQWGFRHYHGAQAELFYNGAKKLETNNGGITVTGTGTFTDRIRAEGGLYYPEGSKGFISHPMGAQWDGPVAPTGAIRIAMPTGAYNSSTMISFWVDVFDYANNETFSVHCAGYTYQTGPAFINTTANIIASQTDRDFTVRFGHDGTRFVVWIGELTSVWGYPKVIVRDVLPGHGAAPEWFADGWDITVEATAFDTVTATRSDNFPMSRDAKLLDGLDSTQFLRSDVSTTFTGPTVTLDGSAVLRLDGTGDASLTSTAHAFQSGLTSSLNIIIDNNEIMARSNGAAATLNLNLDGGIVTVNGGQVWHSTNDGAGSSLDADLLDGLQGTQFLRSDTTDTATGNLTFTGTGLHSGRNKIVLQGQQDGGGNAGLYLWNAADTNWVMYMSTSGAGKAPDGGTAPTPLGGGTLHQVRLRAGTSNANNGFVIENASDQALFNINGAGHSWFLGDVNVGADLHVDGWTYLNVAGANVVLESDLVERGVFDFRQNDVGKWLLRIEADADLNWESLGAYNMRIDGNRILTAADLTDLNDAQTLDGLDSTQFLRSDTTDTFTGTYIAMSGDAYTDYGPNSTYGKYLRIGGNGEASSTNRAGIATTNGNLHIDAAEGTFPIYLNFYGGTGGTFFGSGADTVVAVMGPDGDLWKGAADNSGSKYWHAGNDGSGSGLDADLLDGLDSTKFLRSDIENVTGLFENITLDNALFSNGDTNTYMQFHAADQWRVVVGGAERLEVNTSGGILTGTLTVTTGLVGGAVDDLTWGHHHIHSTNTDFNTFLNTKKYGAHFVQNTTNGPGHTGATQYYHQRMGLGSDYINYSLQLAFPRNRTDAYIYYRNEEAGVASAWYKYKAGRADIADDADLLNGYSSSTANTGNKIALRDGAGDITTRLFRSEYATTNPTVNYVMTQVTAGTGDNYIRPSTPAQFRSAVTDAHYLGISAKAADSELLDGINSTQFIRSDAATTLTNADIIVGGSYRDHGMFGTYNSNLTQHIWSMGTAYRNSAAGTDFGNLYGFAYKHTNNATGGTMATAHQAVWCQNGVGTVALGNNVWTSGSVIAASAAITGAITGASLDVSGTVTFGASNWILGQVNGDDAYLKSNDATVASLALRASDNVTRGYFYATTANLVGILDSDRNWAIKHTRDSHTDFLDNNETMFSVGVGGVTGDYGTVQVKGTGKGSWDGYSIEGAHVFMAAGANCGLYNDTNNEWYLYASQNAAIDLRYNGLIKFATTSGGVAVTGALTTTTTATIGTDLTVSGGDITLGGTGRIQGIDTVSATTDAASKGYVDTAVAGVGYTHPTHAGDDINVDTGALTGATVVSDIDINITTDTLGHVTDANGVISTRTLTLANLGYTGETNATADQTAAEILTAIKTVDGAGSGLDADLLDGLSSASYLRSDTADTFTGNLTILGSISDVTDIYVRDQIIHHFDADTYIQFSAADTWRVVTGGTERFKVTTLCNVTGDLVASGNVTAYSDIRLKEDIETIPDAVETTKKLRGVSYAMKETKQRSIGVIAQELEKVLPELVIEDEEGIKSVAYNKLTALLIEAVKEQSQQIETLTARVEALEG